MTDEKRRAALAANLAVTRRCRPARVFEIFAELSVLPRGSGDTAAVGDFLAAFAAGHGWDWLRDGVGNIIIRKPARGCRGGEGVILQAHQDMVCVKNDGLAHDFARDPILFPMPDNRRLGAKGTSLGADDGIGMALAMALLEDDAIVHPPLEAVFTVDEETDMKGARVLDPDAVQGSHLINLDSEDLGLAYCSSAAGCAMRLALPLRREGTEPSGDAYEIVVEGLAGGHSGVQINEGLGNAIVLLARLLHDAARTVEYRLAVFDLGGTRGADNVIPSRSAARISVRPGDADALVALVAAWRERLRNEYRASDPEVTLFCRRVEPGEAVAPSLKAASRDALLRLIRLLPLGVFRFAQDPDLMAGMAYRDVLVETSCNLGVVGLHADRAVLDVLARGSVGGVLEDLTRRIRDLSDMAGASCEILARTPGWEPSAERPRVQRLFEASAVMPWRLVGVHAGLECGCLVESFARRGRRLHAVSVGPTVRNPHSTGEYLEVTSVQPMWDSLVAVLAGLAE